MQKSRIILVSVGLIVLLALSWFSVLGAKSDVARQMELIAKAKEQIEDEVYKPAIEQLEEARGLSNENVEEIETLLKTCYLSLDPENFRLNYEELLKTQMERKDAKPEVFIEAAQHYLAHEDYIKMFKVLKDGMNKTDSDKIKDFYEKHRYEYELSSQYFEEVGDFEGGSTISVKSEGKWGVANRRGGILLPCDYDKTTFFRNDRAIVKKDGVISAVDSQNYRIALFKGEASDYTVYSSNAIAFLTESGWKYSGSSLKPLDKVFEDAGPFQGELAPAKQDGKWGFINTSLDFVIGPSFKDIKRTELGYSIHEDYYFAEEGDGVYLYMNKDKKAGPYEDAKPFAEAGLAAVKKNNKWGFINLEAEEVIEHSFADADSFGSSIAPVKIDDKWGFIDKKGNIVIEPVFLSAKKCSRGYAPVQTEEGWTILMLKEYKEEAGL